MDKDGLLHLFHLVSPSLPTGAFSYSQGLEWAVEAGWVHDQESLATWLKSLMLDSVGKTDIPLLARMYHACAQGSQEQLNYWCSVLLACREASELRMEEHHRGRALATLLCALEIPLARDWQESIRTSQLAGFALAASSRRIDLQNTCQGYLWAWLENQILAGVKIIPLGQTAGQKTLLQLAAMIPDIVEQGLAIDDDRIGAFSPAFALACTFHETQYTRLYRS
jgi:urease accessory protein